MATTTNYGWDTPDDTDLVKDGAAAIRTLGSSADTTTKNLNPQTTTGALAYRSATANVNTALPIGTTGQVLRVNSGGTAPEWATTADQTPLTTKGDLFTFSTVDARIGVGADNTILVADSNEATGLKWAAPAGGGKVLQVVTATTTTETTVSSTSYTDTTLTASITPSAASSKVLILIAQQITANRVSDNAGGGLRIVRGATSIIDYSPNGYESIFVSPTGATQVVYRLLFNASYLDSPSTTSSTTYKTQIKAFSTANSGYIQAQQNGTPTTSSIILLEIGA